MIKLKVYVPQDGPYGLVPEEGGEPVEEETCYLKSEADKLIAELDIRICEGDEDFEIANNQIKRLLKIVRRQKYKYCLKTAEICTNKSWYYYETNRCSHARRMWKWHDRWLKIADQFKEAK